MLLRRAPLFTCLLSLLSLAACRSPSQRLGVMVDETRRELAAGDDFTGIEEDFVAEHQRRIEAVREFHAEGALKSAQDRYRAAWLLVTSHARGDLELARDLGLEAAEAGENRGFRIAATAIDKLRRQDGLPQRFGTQYEYVEFLDRWRLYPVDPATTDAERAAYGVPSLRELYAREDALNRRRRGEE